MRSFTSSITGCSRSEESGISQAVRAWAAQPPLQQKRVLHLHRSGHLHLSGAVLCSIRRAVRCHSEQRSAAGRLPELCGHNSNSPGYSGQCAGERNYTEAGIYSFLLPVNLRCFWVLEPCLHGFTDRSGHRLLDGLQPCVCVGLPGGLLHHHVCAAQPDPLQKPS